MKPTPFTPMPSASLRSNVRKPLARATLSACLLLPIATFGIEPETGSFYERPVDFSLDFTRVRTALDYDDRNVDTTVKRIGIVYRERMSTRVWLGLHGGHAFVTQTDNAATAGLELSGYYAGLGLYLGLYEGARAGIFFNAAYTYQSVDAGRDLDTVDLTWLESRAELGAYVTPYTALRVYGGVNYGAIEGEERTGGALARTTRTIARTGRLGGFGGLEWRLDNNDYIGAVAQSGVTRMAGVYFGHRF